MKTISMTGGSGLIGRRLTDLLLEKGYQVSHLSRSPKAIHPKVKVYQWDLQKHLIDRTAITTADCVVHLAGASLADKRWTTNRKRELKSSRVNTSDLLFKYLRECEHKVKVFVGSSAIGYYGNRGNELLHETSKPTNEFMSTLCQDWETASRRISSLRIRTVLLRTGIVLSTKGGALPKTDRPIRVGLGAYLGSGEQYYSWIHIDDMCAILLKAIEDTTMEGIYNAVAPNPVSNKTLVTTIAKAMNKTTISLPTPTFLLRAALGEMADIVLYSSKVSSEKIAQTGFVFKYPNLLSALQNLYKYKR